MDSTGPENVTDSSEPQPKKASWPMDPTEAGMVIDSRESHRQKALSPMVTMELGNDTDVMNSQKAKAYLDNPTTFIPFTTEGIINAPDASLSHSATK